MTTRGIYRVDGDGTLTYCITDPEQPRPSSFETRHGDGRTLVTLRRAGDDDIGLDPAVPAPAFPGWRPPPTR